MRFGFFTDRDRTRFGHLRLRRLEKALADTGVLDALLGELAVPPTDTAGLAPRAKRAAIDHQIERLRVTQSSIWFDVPAPEVLAGVLFAASSKRAGDALVELFSPARGEDRLKIAVATWLKLAGLRLYAELPAGVGFDLAGYDKGMLSGLRVVGVAIVNDAGRVDAALDAAVPLMRYTQAAHLACTPAVAAAYLAACAEARGRWDGGALTGRLRAAGLGLLLVEGDAVSQALLPRTQAVDPRALEALAAAARVAR